MPVERPDDHESAAWLDRAVAQGEAVVALAKGDRESGLALLSACADAEAKLPPPFGPPVLAKPSAELLGDELLAVGRKPEAAAAYERALAAAPGRRRSLEGLKEATSS
jgi:predicted negative regulator of RcsB-dependent stress response